LLGACRDVLANGAQYGVQVFTRMEQAVEGGEYGGIVDFDGEGHDGAIP